MTEPVQTPNDAKPHSRRGFHPLPPWVGPSTSLVHGARRPDLNAGAVVPPIYQTTTFHYPREFSDASDGLRPYLYTRNENPTLEVAAEIVRSLEGAEDARVFGSGMGAISAVLLSFLSAGDEVVALADLYGGTLGLLDTLLPRLGVTVRWVSDEESSSPDSVVSTATRVVLLESPTNPRLRLHDLRRWSEAADAAGALVVVDNTFATPINQRPLALGADLVVHSGSKYLGGHSDLMAGVVCGSATLMDKIETTRVELGSVLDPMAAFLLTRGLRTLAVRMARHNDNGRRMADVLAAHPQIRQVDYPGRSGGEQEEIAARQMTGRGGLVTVVVEGGRPGAHRLLRELRLVHVASSLGGVESLASLPVETSHRQLPAAELARRGIEAGTVRFSFGIEEPDDLVRDLNEGLAAL